MPNPRGNPENLKPFTTNREEPLTEKINLRITKSMKEELEKKENPPEFCRQAIRKALDEEKNSDDATEG
ncbi:hypothetical protein H6G81_15515 [Scytonema hofmannii FACHB-248]|jgi:hypothetical protein|uniref:Uncharacterized protein n=1 Tax=Scytonema hofmannii FACHB-248 TaxID=1842502 RepID=A0ABR8GS71_9CYAN|nr:MULTISPECIES: hypothetical protein [Nostocales]MBD2605889.1 hypothetical protein [Scytonema hofmannii FACHB-248]